MLTSESSGPLLASKDAGDEAGRAINNRKDGVSSEPVKSSASSTKSSKMQSSAKSKKKVAQKDFDIVVPPEDEQVQCGERRIELRNKFNTREIDAAKLIAKYDTDRSGTLELEELDRLLSDFNGGIAVKPDELEFIMKVADFNHDNTINENEVLQALRAWYANNEMPESVRRAMNRYNIGFGPVPSAETLKDFLETLNDFTPVKEEDVNYVRSVACLLAGTEEKVESQEMWRAVACWYLNIQRADTSDRDLWRHAFKTLHDKMIDLNVCRKLHEGEVDYTARGTLILLAVLVAAFVFLPLIDILVARNFPSTYLCQSPHLSSVLWWTGTVGLFHSSFGIIAFTVTHLCPEAQVMVLTVWAIFAVLSVILLTLYTVGIVSVSYCTSMGCGVVLWHYCHLVYTIIPIVFFLFLCCGVPALYCYLGSAEFIRHKEVDDRLGNV